MNAAAAIQVQGLCKAFGSLQAVQDVSFDVQAGAPFRPLGIFRQLPGRWTGSKPLPSAGWGCRV